MESVSFTFSYDKNSDQSLIKLWKLTNEKVLSTPLQSTKRLGNRSWRLINHRILHNAKTGTSTRKYSLADLDSSHSLSNLQDLKPSRPSLFSHSSNLSLYTRKRSTQTSLESASFPVMKQKGDVNDSSCELLNVIQDEDESENEDLSDVSDISEISEFSEGEEDDEEDEQEDGGDVVNQCSSPSANSSTGQPPTQTHTTETTKTLPQPSINTNIKNNVTLRRAVDDRISPRNVDHNKPSMTKFYIANSPSPTQKKPMEEEDCEQLQRSQQDSEESRTASRQGSLFNNFQFKEKPSEVEEEEKEEYDDEEEDGDDDDDYYSTDISEDEAGLSEVDEEEEQEAAPEVQRSGETKKSTSTTASKDNHKPSISTANDNESDWLSVSTDSVQSTIPAAKIFKQQAQPMNFPKVDPSSSASLATIPIENSSSRTSLSQMKGAAGPKSLLSSMFLNQMATATTPHDVHPKHQPHLMVDVREKPTLQRSSTTGIITVDRQVKRPSIIFTRKFPSVTDIHVPLTPTDSNSAAPQTPLTKQTSIVGISDINVSIKPTEERSWSEDGSVSASASLLSTSLNKINRSASHHSIKNLLSKSSLNITKIYQSTTKTRHRDNSIFHKRNDELVKPDSTHGNMRHSPSSLTSSSSILMVSQKSSSTPPPPVLPRVTTTENEFQSELMNNEELSKSLKDSILIDNKLGKIAMPEKVIDAGSFLRRESRLADNDDFDDYHAKGW
ncbi:hypothetical protein Cantr_09082 [Candida viswanathii]|uniref:Nitrogen regulatory protein areA GATA-like domain-containing protein n=1 Tax=Candida viswanathii TaxID=5486 RepID=A0A367Y9K3_9ASCO|nr:hypothetical protein Cantr_09082 [Candida viswanathii]